VDKCLHAFVPKPGDCVFLPAGTVHAVGGGVLMAEVQQTSDATFRLFDWNRLGTDGNPRALHVRESLEAIDWAAGPVAPVRAKPVSQMPTNVRSEELVRCRYFELDRFDVRAPLSLASGRLSIWIVLDGKGTLASAEGAYRREFRCGETVLVPASAPPLTWRPASGGLTLLRVHLPQR
jgi:mannose-6-phosphate isomerase